MLCVLVYVQCSSYIRSPLQSQKARECEGEVKYLEDYRKKADEVCMYVWPCVCAYTQVYSMYVCTYVVGIM